MSRQSCAVCAWRENCNKRFSVCDCGAHCPDYSRDISINDIEITTDSKESLTT